MKTLNIIIGILFISLFLPTVSASNILIQFPNPLPLINVALNNTPVLGYHNSDGSNGELNIFINNLTLINASNVASQCETNNLITLNNCNNGDISINLTNGTSSYNLTYRIVNDTSNNRYTASTISFNISQKPIFYGKGYNLTVSVVDVNGTRTTETLDLKLLRDAISLISKGITLDENLNASFDFLNESKIKINSIKFSANMTDNFFTVAIYDTPVFNITTYSLFGRYYNIGLSPTAKSLMQWAVLRVYYNDSELGSLNENLLRLARLNDNNQLEVCNSPYGGVDTINNYIYCNTTAFSEWGVVQVQESSSPSSSSGGSSGSGSYSPPSTLICNGINGKDYVLVNNSCWYKNQTIDNLIKSENNFNVAYYDLLKQNAELNKIIYNQNKAINSLNLQLQEKPKVVQTYITKTPMWIYPILTITSVLTFFYILDRFLPKKEINR